MRRYILIHLSADNEEEGENTDIRPTSPILKKTELRSLKSAGISVENLSETKRMKSASNLNAEPSKYLQGDENFSVRLTSEPDLPTSDLVYFDEAHFTHRARWGMFYQATRFLGNVLKIYMSVSVRHLCCCFLAMPGSVSKSTPNIKYETSQPDQILPLGHESQEKGNKRKRLNPFATLEHSTNSCSWSVGRGCTVFSKEKHWIYTLKY